MEKNFIFISYHSSHPIDNKDGINYYSFDATKPDNVRVIVMLGNYIDRDGVDDIEYELKVSPKYILFFSEDVHKPIVEKIIRKLYSQILAQTTHQTFDAWEYYNLYASKLLSQVKLEVLPEDVKEYITIDSEITIEENNEMANNPLENVWLLGHLQRLLMHSFVMQSNPEIDDLDSKSYQIALAHNTGTKVDVVKGYIEILHGQGLVERSGRLQIENGVYEAVNKKIDDEYDLKQILPSSENSDISGLVFLQYSHDRGKKGAFTQLVKNIFQLGMENIAVTKHESREYAFRLESKNDWRASIFCDVHSNAINAREIGDVAIKAMKELRQNPHIISIEIVCGSSFNLEAEEAAEEAGIHLIDAFSLLKLNKTFNSFSSDKKRTFQKNFIKFFTKTGGYVSVRQGLHNVFKK